MKTRLTQASPALLALALAGLSLLAAGCDGSSSSPSTQAPQTTTPTPTQQQAAAPAEPAPASAPTPGPTTVATPNSLTAEAQPPSGKKKYTFGVIAKSQGNPVFQAARTGAFDAAAELGPKEGVDIVIEWRTPNSEDAQQQAQNIEALVNTGVDGIAVSCSDAKVLTAAINSAVDKGVPVVTFDSDAPESKRFAMYGMDDLAAGQKLGEQLVKAMGEKGIVAILAGNQNAPNLQTRARGVKEYLAKHSGITIKDTYYHAETAPEAAAKVQQVQNSNPDITGWAMVGGWPLFTENALTGVADKGVKVVSVDTLPQQLEYVRKGEVQSLVGQNCYGWGYESVRLLLDKAHKGAQPKDVFQKMEPDIVDKSNVEKFAGLWEKWLGKK